MTRARNYWAEHDVYDHVHKYWPYDGPHTPETIQAGASALPALVQYLGNATSLRGRLTDPEEVHDVLMSVHDAMYSLRQLLEQAASALDHMGTPESTAVPIAAITEAVGYLGVPAQGTRGGQRTALVSALMAAVVGCNQVGMKAEVGR